MPKVWMKKSGGEPVEFDTDVEPMAASDAYLQGFRQCDGPNDSSAVASAAVDEETMNEGMEE